MKKTFRSRLVRDFKINKYKYLLVLPVIIYFILFHYKAMYGIIIAFKDYNPARTIADSEWVGFKYFIRFFKSRDFLRVLRNTFRISGLSIVFSFPAPIILALLLNEVKNIRFKRLVQTVTYMPHFIALVVVCGLLTTFCHTGGLFNQIIALFGGKQYDLLSKASNFYPIYILSGIWQSVGWDSIIYLAALSGIDQELYEAATLDGANRFQQMLHITLPGLLPTISILLVLRIGQVLNVGYEKILLLYQPLTYRVADVISTYVYRMGMQVGNYSYATAVSLFNSVVNIAFLVAANHISKKRGQSGLF